MDTVRLDAIQAQEPVVLFEGELEMLEEQPCGERGVGREVWEDSSVVAETLKGVVGFTVPGIVRIGVGVVIGGGFVAEDWPEIEKLIGSEKAKRTAMCCGDSICERTDRPPLKSHPPRCHSFIPSC